MNQADQTAIAAPGRTDSAGPKAGLFAAGGVFGAIAASSCCIVPLMLFTLGVSGAWIGNLTALAPYQPIFIVVTLGFLAAGYYFTYWKPKTACAEGAACARPLPGLFVKSALWIATLLVVAVLVFPYFVRMLLGSD